MSGAKALIEALKREGIKVIFGLPGGAIMPVYDELLDSGIRHILVRHEQCAAHMADGYARASGRVGVCIATSGPGSTNLVTGIANAYMDSSPVVCLTGQVPRQFIGKNAFQEVDILGIIAAVTKYSVQVRTPREIPIAVKNAFYLAGTWRKGPVLIDLPKDVQTLSEDINFPKETELLKMKPEKLPSKLQVAKAVKLLEAAERPIILVGGGVTMSDSGIEVLALAKRFGAPIVTTLMAKGCVPEDNSLVLGMIGMHGMPYSNQATVEADVILAVGCRFSDRTIGSGKEFGRGAKIIHLDIDPSEIGKNVTPHLSIVGEAKKVLAMMLNTPNKPRQRSTWLSYVEKLRRDYKPISDAGESLKPHMLMKELRNLLPKKAIVTTEVGQNQMWAAAYLKSYLPRTFISSGGLGTMGFGFPAALGAKVAHPEVPVVDVAGDGSFQMTMHDLATSIMEKIPVIVTILNNSMLGMVAQWQRALYARRYSHVYIGGTPDFVRLAEAYGAVGIKVESYEEFRKAILQALKSDVTTVIDIPISPEEDSVPITLPAPMPKED